MKCKTVIIYKISKNPEYANKLIILSFHRIELHAAFEFCLWKSHLHIQALSKLHFGLIDQRMKIFARIFGLPKFQKKFASPFPFTIERKENSLLVKFLKRFLHGEKARERSFH